VSGNRLDKRQLRVLRPSRQGEQAACKAPWAPGTLGIENRAETLYRQSLGILCGLIRPRNGNLD
jgi:hypothetical protein